MKKSKSIIAVVSMLVFMLVLTGCYRTDLGMTIGKDGIVTAVYQVDIAEELYQEMEADGMFTDVYNVTDKVIDNVNYKHLEASEKMPLEKASSFLVECDMGLSKISLSKTSFKANYEAVMTEEIISQYEELGYDIQNSVKMIFSLTFPTEVKSTNGKLNKTKKKVTWNLNSYKKGLLLYADCNKKAPITISGVKNNNTYKKNVVIKFSSKDGIKSAYLNKKKIKSGNKVTKDGKYTLTITSKTGLTRKVKFVVDKTKPSIKGVKNKNTYKKTVTLKFADKTSGLKSVKVNKKKITAKKYKSGYKIKKNGKYTVSVVDKAGNTKTISFRISKK